MGFIKTHAVHFRRVRLASRAALLMGASALVLPAPALADAMIEGARLCTQQFPVQEKQNNIPSHLLAAIASTESGRWHKGLGMNLPWPWTINVEGKGYYFDSKAEAIAQTQRLLASGRRSIDVGCMQVNLKHHPTAFSDLNAAFDPATNVAYSAKFLKDNYATLGDWIKATAAYHSRTPVHGQRYLVNIERSWNRIVAKVAEARANQGYAPANAVAPVQTAAAAPAARVARPFSAARPTMQAPQRARVIRVNDTLRRSSEVMVVRAAPIKAEEPVANIAVAASAASAAPADVMPVGSSVRQVDLDKASAAAVAKPSDKRFVFTN